VDGLYRLVRRLAVTQYNDSIYVKSFRLRRLNGRLAVTLCQIERYGKDWDVPITQAPNRKSLFYKVLWHYFGLSIIQAPKRKSRANKEMRPNGSFLMSMCAGAARARSRHHPSVCWSPVFRRSLNRRFRQKAGLQRKPAQQIPAACQNPMAHPTQSIRHRSTSSGNGGDCRIRPSYLLSELSLPPDVETRETIETRGTS
jgi:hypothetical protein